MGPYGWQALYKAVALEANFRKMPHCIALAEKAIKALQNLSRSSGPPIQSVPKENSFEAALLAV
jgi:hypothetical protein